jgi:MFS family permease
VYLAALLVTALGAAENPLAAPPAPPARRTIGKALAESFDVDLRTYPAFRWWFVNRLLFWSAFIAMNTFLLFYVMNVVGLAEAPANAFIGKLTMVLGGGVALASFPVGWLADRVGRKPVLVASGVITSAGTLIILIGRTTGPLWAGAAVIGLGIGSFLASSWALVTDIVPRREAARYLGIANIAAAGGSALARFLGGALIDPINRLSGSPAAGYLTLYTIAAAFFLLSAVAVLPLSAPRVGAETEPECSESAAA